MIHNVFERHFGAQHEDDRWLIFRADLSERKLSRLYDVVIPNQMTEGGLLAVDVTADGKGECPERIADGCKAAYPPKTGAGSLIRAVSPQAMSGGRSRNHMELKSA